MHQTRLAACLLAVIVVPGSYASTVAQSKPVQTATIVSVCKHRAEELRNYSGDNPSDAPLQAEIYVYDVTVRSGCNTYIVRYASPYDYLPGALAANRQMPVRVAKHDIAFDLGDRQMQLPIARSKKDRTANCQ